MPDQQEWEEVAYRVRGELEADIIVYHLPCPLSVVDDIMRHVAIMVKEHYDADRWSLLEFCLDAAQALLDAHVSRVVSEPPPQAWWTTSEKPVEEHEVKEKRGRESEPTVDWEERKEVFTSIKAKNPRWQQWMVAAEASKPVEDGGYGLEANEHTVRNTYRRFGLEWRRSPERRQSGTS